MSAEIDKYELQLAQNQAELVRLRHAVRDLEARLQYEQYSSKRRMIRPDEPLTPATSRIHENERPQQPRQVIDSPRARESRAPEVVESRPSYSSPISRNTLNQPTQAHPPNVPLERHSEPIQLQPNTAPTQATQATQANQVNQTQSTHLNQAHRHSNQPAPSAQAQERAPTMPSLQRQCIACKAIETTCWRASWNKAKLCNSCGLKYRKSGAYCTKCSRVLSSNEATLNHCSCGGKVVRQPRVVALE